MSKTNDRAKRDVDEGYQKIIQLYQQIQFCKRKNEGSRLWNELTKHITQFRKSLSRLESHVYEELFHRFDKSEKSEDSSRERNSWQKEPEMKMLFVEEDFPPITIPYEENVEPMADEWKLEESALRFPLPVYLRLGEIVRVKLLQVISPLELYVLRVDDLHRLEEVERVLDACLDEIRQQPLMNELCIPDRACAALVGNEMKRAVIRMRGNQEVQVYLVDFGRTHFVPRDHVFQLPKTVANMAAPLAHYCSLTDIDNHLFDQKMVTNFVDGLIQKEDLLIYAHGTHHPLYGELVNILPYRSDKKTFQERVT